MGWDYFRPPARKDSIAILRDEFSSTTWHDAALIGGDTVYAAVSPNKNPAIVTAYVILIDRRNGRFGYKPMDESMGPCASDCPAHILDKLTAPPNEWARQWRERCRANWQRRQERARQELEQINRRFQGAN